MEFLTEQTRVRMKIEEMVALSKEKRERLDPVLLRQSDKALTFLKEVKKKGALKDRRRTTVMRKAFEQNYEKRNLSI